MSWLIDPSHTRANFSVRHMMISNVHGLFDQVTGTVDFDETNPAATQVDVQIAAASIQTRDEKRDGHLKSPDFLDAEKYPHLSFKSNRVELVGETTAKMHGDLTIRDVTKPVVLDVEFNGLAKAPWGTTNAGFSAHTKINRKEWGLTWNMGLETGGVLVGDTVNITLEVEIVKQEAPKAVTATAA